MGTKILTIEEFNRIPDGDIIGTGVLPNSPEGIFMTHVGGNLRWVAVKGYGCDWTAYCGWEHYSAAYVEKHGDKIFTEEYIRRCVPCSDKVFALYRY